MINRGPVEQALRVTPALVALCSGGVWLAGDVSCAFGLLLGGALSSASLWAARWTVQTTVREGFARVPAHSKLQLLLIAKLPVFAAVVFSANSLGTRAVIGFLAGYLSVYLALVVGAVSQKAAPADCDEDR